MTASNLNDAIRTWWDGVRDELEWMRDGDLNDDIWTTLPEIDSKVVAGTAPIFSKFLGVELKAKHIRPGGYADIEDLLKDLVPKVRADAEGYRQGGIHE